MGGAARREYDIRGCSVPKAAILNFFTRCASPAPPAATPSVSVDLDGAQPSTPLGAASSVALDGEDTGDSQPLLSGPSAVSPPRRAVFASPDRMMSPSALGKSPPLQSPKAGKTALRFSAAQAAKLGGVAVEGFPRIDRGALLDAKCEKCNTVVDPLKTACKFKCGGTFYCPRCNVKQVQLSRLFGGWPPQDFKRLSKEDQQAFWATPCGSQDDVEKLVVDTLFTRRIEAEEREKHGTFQPLGWYAANGYDVEMIKTNSRPEDIQKHRVLGDCYRVVLTTDRALSREEQVKTYLLSLKRPPTGTQKQVASLEALGSDQQVAGGNPGGDGEKFEKEKKSKRKSRKAKSSSSSSSGSSTSESPSSKKRKRSKDKKTQKGKGSKDKKDEMEKKAKAAAALKKKEEDKQSRKIRAECNRVIARLAPIITSIEADMADDAFKHVPTYAAVPGKTALKAATVLFNEAKLKLKQDNPNALSKPLEEIQENSKKWVEVASLVAQMLQTAKKHT